MLRLMAAVRNYARMLRRSALGHLGYRHRLRLWL